MISTIKSRAFVTFTVLCIVCVISGMLLINNVRADENVSSKDLWEDDEHSYDKARKALDRGDILPIDTIFNYLKKQVQGDVVSTFFEFEYGQWVYEFKIIDSKGRLMIVHLDATTGRLIQISDKPGHNSNQ